ncbi:hypothetical protein K525DRAFT_196942 [Schizophyllum commune Loenen D]|nr:hypothetical protein K525DRAFT_196942 [Schizophyllum commune Loenen D]
MHPVRYVDLTGCLYRNEAPTYTQKYVLSNIVPTQYHEIVALEQELQVYRATISSPIRRLPIELLARIMVLIVTGDKGDLDPCDVLALAHVSRLWRYTAFREADLWTRLELSWEQACHPRAIEQTIAWFYRARDHPVCLSVDDYCDCTRPAPSDCPLLAFVLLRLGPQILELNLRCPVEWLDSLASCADGSFPILRKFQLDVQDNEWLCFDLRAEFPTKFPINTFQRLKVFHIRGFDGIMCEANAQLVSLFSLPWAQLQSLQLDDVEEIHEWGETVLRCTSLVCAKIRSKGPASAQWPLSGGVPPTKEVIFPHLRHLETLDLAFERYPSKVLDFASFPSLRTLELRIRNREFLFDWSHEWQPFDHWVSLHNVVQTTRRLSALVLEGFSFHTRDDELHHLLAQLPFLTYLTFQYCDCFSIGTLQTLSAPSFLPVLEDLRFSEVSMRYEDDTTDVQNMLDLGVYYATYCAIEKLLRARVTSPKCRLRFFKFTFMDYDEEREEDCKVILQALESWQTTCMITKGLVVCIDGIPEWEDSDDEREREEAGQGDE